MKSIEIYKGIIRKTLSVVITLRCFPTIHFFYDIFVLIHHS